MLRNFFTCLSSYVLLLIPFLLLTGNNCVLAQQEQNLAEQQIQAMDILGAARQQVDSLLNNPGQAKDAKIWHKKAWIYKELYLAHPEQDKDSLYREQSLQALVTSIKLDTAKKLRKDNHKLAVYVVNTFFNDGKKAFDSKQYSEAADYFISYVAHHKALDAAGLDKNALFYAGYNAWLAGESQKAKEYLTQAVAQPQPQPLSFVVLSKLLLSETDTTASYQTIEKAAKLFPDNKDIAITRANVYLLSKRYNEALPLLEKILRQDSTNVEVLVAAGSTLERLAEMDSLPAAKVGKAMYYYEQALKSEPDNFVANYNLGTILYNKALAQETPQTRSSKLNMLLLVKEGEDNTSTFMQALPLLEKASTLAPAHKEALLALETIYFKLHQTEKYNEVKAKLDVLEKQSLAKAASVE